MITVKRLRLVLNYDPETGAFTNRIPRPHAPLGARAGWLGQRGYWQVCVGCKTYLAHRLAWLYVHGAWPNADLDHINGDPADNRIANLRLATSAQNTANARRYRNNKSGYKGVIRHKRGWQANIFIAGRTRHLGIFATPEEAHAAYAAAARKIHGAFARVS